MDAPVASRPIRVMHRSAGVVVMGQEGCLALRVGREWTFPKGHIERDERPEDAAIREVREETGLEVAIDDDLGSTQYDFRSPDGQEHRKRVEWFVGHVVGGSLALEPQFREARFLAPAEAERLLTHRSDRELADRAFVTAPNASR